MQINIRRSTYKSSYRQDGFDQAMKLYSVLKGTYGTLNAQHSRRFLNVEDFPLNFCRNTCQHDKLPLLFLRFDHSKDLPLAKSKLTSFWNFLISVGMQGPPMKKSVKSQKIVGSEDTLCSQSHQQSFVGTEKDASQLEFSPNFRDLKQIFDLFLSKGLDKTALSIDNNYRVHPCVCVCQEPCCNCVNYSSHLHKLGLHHENEALNKVQEKIGQPKSIVFQFADGRPSLKSFLRNPSQSSGPMFATQTEIPSADDEGKKKPFNNVFGNNIIEADNEADEDRFLIRKKSDLSQQTQSLMPSECSFMNGISHVASIQTQIIPELTNLENSKPIIKCKPSVRSVRRNFKEIEPGKYQNLLLDLIKNPENCLLSHQSKKERVLRPKLVPNDCQAKRPKWRI